MSPDSEPLRRAPRPAAELDVEREVDFAGYARAIAARWWLVVLGAVLGAVIGFLLGRADGSTFQAQAIVYLGQPLTATGSASISSLTSDPSGVAAIARSQAVVDEVAGQVGMSPAELRRGISASALGERRAQTTVTLVGVTVRGDERAPVEQAANLLAEEVVERVSTYADAKIATYEQRLEAQQGRVETLERQLDDVAAAIQPGSGLSSAEQLTLTTLLALRQEQLAGVQDQILSVEQLLTVARDVERGSVVTEASAARVDARSARTSIVVGAVIGLLLGALAALFWGPLARLRSP
jgi:capsular polysaccharide biosynthesis protein